MPAKFNYLQIANKLASSPAGAARINTIMQSKFELAKDHLITEFENHKVTQEIAAGIESSNISNTLNGYGNLYSFLGFDSDEQPDPTAIVPQILESDLKLISTSRGNAVVSGNKIQIKYRYSVRVPRQELMDNTKIRFEPGLSWLYEIERGISGFSHYISSKMNDLSKRSRPDKFPKPPSFSEGGLQTKNELRSGDFTPTLYWNALLRDMVNFFRNL